MSTADLPPVKPPVRLAGLARVLVPAALVLAGLGVWLWSRHGLAAYFDMMSAYVAGCL